MTKTFIEVLGNVGGPPMKKRVGHKAKIEQQKREQEKKAV